MPIDPSIAMSYKPVQIQDPMEMYGKRQQIQSNALAMQKYQTEATEKNALAQLISQPGYDPYNEDAQAAAFRAAPTLAPALFKNLMETRTANVKYDTDKLALGTLQRNEANAKKLDAITRLVQFTTPESAVADLARSVAAGELSQAQADAILPTLPKTEADMPAWKQKTMFGLLDIKDQLDQTTRTDDLGGKVQTTVGSKYAGGAAPVVTTVDKTATPGDLLTSAAAARRLAQDAAQFTITTGLKREELAQKGGDFLSKMSKKEQSDYRSLVATDKTINSALERIEKTPTAFGFGKGAATSVGGVTGGRMGASIMASQMTDDEIQARSFVYNIVSAAIKERAGTAQSAQELKVLDGFLPGPFDDARVIKAKLNAFKQYINTKREGYEPADGTGAAPAAQTQGGSSPPASALQEGQYTTFTNGQVWGLDMQGKPVRIK